MSTDAGDVTGTADKDYNIIWFTEACLSNASKLDELPLQPWRVRLSRDGLDGKGFLELDGRHHVRRAVPAPGVVELLDPGADDLPGLVLGAEVVPAQDLPLQGGEERLGGGVVEA